MKTLAIILLAGGGGIRMGIPTLKQYLPLNGTPLALHSYKVFASLPEVKELIVVCHPAYRHLFPLATRFALPGERRQDSVYSGLQETTAELICTHDAARPFIDASLIRNVCAAATEHGAATAAVPVKFTVRQSNDEGKVIATPPREYIWEIQTPQAVKREYLLQGFSKAYADGITVTDDVALAELIGVAPKLVHGCYKNIKITTPDDFAVAEQLCRHAPQV